jgi:dTDP-4-amino-4,6-dideoxygalactose transaminase
MIGGFGDAEVFSFHATKYFNTFEGGAVTTNNDELAARISLMRNFGFSGYDNVIHIGTNGKMNEISAAMGLTGLESLDQFKAANRTNYEHYRTLLGEIPGLRLFATEHREERNYQHVVVEVDESGTGIGRDSLVRLLHAENVLARRYFYPGCHRMEPYRSLFPEIGRSLPATEQVCARTTVLPTGTMVGAADIDTICGLLAAAVAQAPDITSRINAAPGERDGYHVS